MRLSSPDSTSCHHHERGVSAWVARFLLLIMAMSMPWDLFQRIPYAEVTLTKGAGGLVILLWFLDAVRSRHRLVTWHALWFVGLALVALGLTSAAWSPDRAATLSRTGIYFSYVFLAGATVYWIADRHFAQQVGFAFVASSAMVGLASILCRLGLLIPTHVVTTTRLGGRVTPEAWHDLTSRMVCASDDFNLGVLPLLIAAVLLLYRSAGVRVTKRSSFDLCLFLWLSAGIAISLSRTSLLVLVAACVVLAALGVRRTGRRTATALGACVAAVILAALLVGPQGLVDRMKAGLGARDASYEGRIAAFQAAFDLLPHYALSGIGLDASDGVIAASRHGARVNGVTVHSVPFKILLELGVIGLALYVSGWFVVLRLLWRRRRDPHYGSFLAAGLTIFVVLLVQPFMAQSLFPFLIGVALGPLLSPRLRPETTAPATRARASTASAVLVAVSVILPNLGLYQGTARLMHRYTASMAHGLEAERSGDWERSAVAYATAQDLAESAAGDLGKKRYYAIAAEVFDLDYVERAMHVSGLHEAPGSLAMVGLARVAYAQGQWSQALEFYSEVLEKASDNAGILWERAETLWRNGQFKPALDDYLASAELADQPNQQAHAQHMNRIEDRIAFLRSQTDTAEAHLEMAALLRKQGRWDDALALYREVAKKDATSSEALYHLAIQLELEGNTREAVESYRRILTRHPDHVGAVTRLGQLNAQIAGIP